MDELDRGAVSQRLSNGGYTSHLRQAGKGRQWTKHGMLCRVPVGQKEIDACQGDRCVPQLNKKSGSVGMVVGGLAELSALVDLRQ